MNKVELVGRISRDIDLRYTSSGTAVCQINVAVNRPVQKDKEPEADFINVVVWDKQAENAAKYLAKGSLIAVEGRIQTRNYDNDEGKKVYVTEVVASHIEFLSSASKSEKQTEQEQTNEQNTEQDPYAEFGQRITVEEVDNNTPELPW